MPPSKKTQAAAWLDLLIEKGEALRTAGVLSINLDGCAVTLAPVASGVRKVEDLSSDEFEDLVDKAMAKNKEERSLDVLDDPLTFGTSGTVPGYTLRDSQ